MKRKPIRILLADDHTLFRNALTRLISTFGPCFEVHEAANGKEAIAFLDANIMDVVLLDIQMPEMGGVDVAKHLRRTGSQVKIMMLTQFEDESLIVYLLAIGVNGFLLKNCPSDELERALRQVVKEGHYYTTIVLRAVEHNLSLETRLSNLDISPREFQVLVLLKDGSTNKEVARNLGLTLRTVESYRKRLIKKTNTRNTVELVSLAYRTGILSR